MTIRLRPLDYIVPIMGPGATVGPVRTRVCWACPPRPSTLDGQFPLRPKPTAWRDSRGKSPREDSGGSRGLWRPYPLLPPLQGDLPWGEVNAKSSTGHPSPRGDCFAAKQPLQSAHGLCSGRRVTRASARGDDDAAVAILVIKGVNKAAPRAPDYKNFLFGVKGTGRRYAPRPTSPWAPPRSSAAPAGRPAWTVVSLPQASALRPWTASMDSWAAVHRAPPSVAMW